MKNILKFFNISMEINIFVGNGVDNKVVFCYSCRTEKSFAIAKAQPKTVAHRGSINA
jgi:hypothetical protein